MDKINNCIVEIKNFFDNKFTEEILFKNFLINSYLLIVKSKLTRKEIMEIIDFSPPFLRLDKVILLNSNKKDSNPISTILLGTGKLTIDDTLGHYNGSLFLSLCGWLMAQTACVHLATIFPFIAPQVIEASGVKALSRELYKPSKEGSKFYTESNILYKKLQLVMMETKLAFENFPFAVAEKVKIMLTNRESSKNTKEIPQ